MWTSPSLWLSVLAAVAQASLNTGQLYIYEADNNVTTKSHVSISADTARLVLASRLQVDRHHGLGDISDDAMKAVNDLGNRRKLFATSVDQSKVALVLANSEEGLAEDHTHRTAISALPSLKHTEELYSALAVQKVGWQGQSLPETAQALRSGKVIATENMDALIQFASTRDSLRQALHTLRKMDYAVLVLVTPPNSKSTSRYGSYSVPLSSLNRRQSNEQPLEEGFEDALFGISSSVSENESFHASQSNNTTPLRGILPFCYSSRSLCESTTRNCTGHGACALAYTQIDGSGDQKGTPCYQCSCVASVRKNKDGTKKTTNWGGPACQKKDVVAPFWLIAGFTVVMMGLISFGIGMLWSMGDEQLPSVIGAGVSGVTRK